jgi:hypothetical protein
MEKVSAMKKVALFLMIVGLAVAMVACQGAVGPKGDTGDPGKDGVDGVDGTDGQAGNPAFQPLALKAEGPLVVISDTMDADEMTVPGAAVTIDIADYMRGTADRTYSKPANSQTATADQIFEAKLEGTMLTITPKTPQPTTTPYNVEQFTIMVSDGGESNPIRLVVPARRNRAPTATDDDTATVGTQAPDKAPDAVRACSANDGDGAGANECYVDVEFEDTDSETNAVVASDEKLIFTPMSSDTSKVEVVSVDNAPGANPGDPSNPLMARLVVRGIASTWDATLETPAHDPVEVVVVATDDGELTVRGKAQITVDGAPTLKSAIPGGTVSQGATTNTYVIQDVSGFFEDPEGATLTFMAESDNTNAAMVEVSTNMVTVTRNAPGTAEITVTASEPSGGNDPQQTVKGTFTVTAN